MEEFNLFHWNDITCIWEETDKIFAESAIDVLDLQLNAQFGLAVAISNGIIAVGSEFYNNVDSTDAGMVYIYQIVGTEAVFVERLEPFKNDGITPDNETDAYFGCSLKMHGDRLIIGARNESEDDLDISVNGAGAAYIYEWNGSSFDYEQKVIDPTRNEHDHFGSDVTIFGNFATVSADSEDYDAIEGDLKFNAGAIFVYELNTSTDVWEFNQKLTAPDRTGGDRFGESIDMTQEKIVVGARFNETNELEEDDYIRCGSAYVFDNSLGTFSFEQKIVASDRDAYNDFGFRVAIHNETIIIGAPLQGLDEAGDAPDVPEAGSGYVFNIDGGDWTESQKIVAFDRNENDRFGEAAAITDNRIMFGAFGQDFNEVGLGVEMADAGAVYIYNTGGKPVLTEIHVDQDGACTNTPVTLTIEGVLYDADDWEWHAGDCDGEILGTGTSIIVEPTEITTYCARAIGCFNYVEPEDCHCVDVNVKEGNWHQTTTLGQYEQGNDVVTDSDGNVYVTGAYTGFAVFDGGDNSDVTADAYLGITTAIKSYVAKYNNCGDLMWVTYAEGDGTHDYANEIVIRESGGFLYIVGEFENTITFVNGIGDFGYGTGTETAARPGKNGYVARMNIENGKVDFIDPVWSGGNSSNLTAITINEENGKIFVAGQTYDAVGFEKVFIRKYNPSYSTIGTQRWNFQSYYYNGAIVNAMDFDEDSPEADVDGALWVIGTFRNSFLIGSGIGPSFSPIGASFADHEAFVLKYFDDNGGVFDSPTGDFLKKGNILFGADVWMEGNDIAVDPTTGNAFLMGSKLGTATDAFSLAAHNLADGFGRPTGYFISMRFDGEIAPATLSEITRPVLPQNSYGNGVDVINGIAYFTGSRTGQVSFDFDDVVGSTLAFDGLIGDHHLYAVAYSTTDGSYQWSNGTKNPDGAENCNHGPGAIVSDPFGHLFIVGSYQAWMGYILGDADELYYGSNGGSLFTIRVDIEGVDESALQSPADDPNFEIESELIDHIGIDTENEFILLNPNPASQFVEIKLENIKQNVGYQINVLSTDGRIVFSGIIEEMSMDLDVSNYNTGIYVVRIFNETENYTCKFVKIE
ncbi:MAG: T9SS type A sorting domain-containing protein [Crocinitomix sp.]|nr:T9SS type A sorting domain-containing protein [Crocinitomix sp.]